MAMSIDAQDSPKDRAQSGASVPHAYQDRFGELAERIDRFCDAHLNDEYKKLCCELALEVCKEELPLLNGKPEGWAAGIVYAIGRVNFLTDPSESPHMKSKEIAKHMGVSPATMQAKYRIIWDELELMQLHPDWSLPSRLDDNPLVWMLSINGFMRDVRTAPREAQVAAYEAGLIPYIPADQENQQASKIGVDSSGKLFELEVSLLDGPITQAFLKKNPEVIRTIEIRGDQTLEDLHHAIFDAYDREDEHIYEFQVGGKGPHDDGARRYVLPMAIDDPFSERKPAGDVTQTRIASLGLKIDEPFGYWFDFGDDWWHTVYVLAIHDKAPRGRYPKITNRVGKSPPQYAAMP